MLSLSYGDGRRALNWITRNFTQGRGQWWTLVYLAMNLQVLKKAVNFWTG
jgi:hypothetical protein